MKIAVEGCAHGELDTIYELIDYIEEKNQIKVDLLICCGDFQSTRNLDDLRCMSVPLKYQSMCSFHKYYSGEKTAPVLTIFIGGNHEASNYLQELPYGGWVAPNIYYMGYAGVVNVAGVRIAGLSGIYKGHDYCKGRYELPPYQRDSITSCYHIRNLDVFRLKQLVQPLNICLSHDWPAGIYRHGNMQKLYKIKRGLRDDIDKDALGSEPTAELLHHLKPDYWFSAHLHVKFAATVKHTDEENGSKSTKFLSLDKCLPRKDYLQVLDVPHEEGRDIELHYDLEWLTILQITNHLLSVKRATTYMPGPNSSERWDFRPTEQEMELVKDKFNNDFKIPKNFVKTAPDYHPDVESESPVQPKINPQTTALCDRLAIDDPIVLLLGKDRFNNSDSSFNISSFSYSSFIESGSETDPCSPMNRPVAARPGEFVRSPLKLPTPVSNWDEASPSSNPSTPLDKTKSGESASPPKPSELSTSSEGEINSPSVQDSSFSNVQLPSPSALPMPTFPDRKPEDEDNDLPAPSGPKKFRRRNVSLYGASEEE